MPNGISDDHWNNLSDSQKIDILHDYVKEIRELVNIRRTFLIAAVGGVVAVAVTSSPSILFLIKTCLGS